MKKYSDEVIKETRNLISKGEYGLSAKIKNLDVWFWGDTLEEALNACLRWNIAQTFEKYIKKYTPKVVKQTDGSSKIFTEKH